MTESGTATFSDPGDYQAGIGGAHVSLVITGCGDFKARLTWLKLRHLHVLRGRENTARIAYVSLLPTRAFVSFPLIGDPRPIWSGVELRSGDVVFHSRGERSHQVTRGASQWGLLSLPPRELAVYGKAFTEREIVSPPAGRVLRPHRAAAAQLQRLHAKACDLAETNPAIIVHQEAARALEQELMHALVTCLTADGACASSATKRHHAEIMVQLENALASNLGRPFRTRDLCAVMGVPERTLRVCCAEFLGVSPSRYLRLRRLNQVRAELWRADPMTASVAKIAQRHRFSELGRFAAAYRAVFGEAPSDTLRRAAMKLA